LRLRVKELEDIITDGMQKNKTLLKKLEGAETRANNILTNNNYKRRVQDAEQQAQNLRKEKENSQDEIKNLQRKLNGTSWQAGVRFDEKIAL
jgi:predicted RNase H-like nuclease (RuvC/YqgF family)